MGINDFHGDLKLEFHPPGDSLGYWTSYIESPCVFFGKCLSVEVWNCIGSARNGRNMSSNTNNRHMSGVDPICLG